MGVVLRSLEVLGWFIWQALNVGGVGFAYFFAPFLVLATLLAAAFRKLDAAARRRLLPLLVIFPAIWLFVGLWGAIFWRDWARHAAPNPAWVTYPPTVAPLFFLGVAALYVWRQAGARWFTAVYALINFYFVLAMSFLAGMAVTGSWL